MRDNQRQKVYNWEWTLKDPKLKTKLTLQECQELVDKVWYRYKPNAKRSPVVQSGRGRGVAYNDTRITLGVPARNPHYVLHEVAHCLTCYGDLETHGPEFVRVLCDLLDWYSGTNYAPSARKAKVKVAAPDKVAKPIHLRQSKIDEAFKAMMALTIQERSAVTKMVREKTKEL